MEYNENKLNTNRIIELGDYISDFLRKCNIYEFQLELKVDDKYLDKINEDLFYRLYNNENNHHFTKSDKILINVENGQIIINKKNNEK